MHFRKLILSLLLSATPCLLFSQTNHSSKSLLTNFSLEFDGIDDQVIIEDINGLYDLNTFTIEAWTKIFELNRQEVILHKGAFGESPKVNTNFALFIGRDSFAHVLRESADSRNFEVIGTTTIENNKWYHIAGVRNAYDNTLKIFVNGQFDAPPVVNTGTSNLKAAMNFTINPAIPGLVGYWRLDTGQGQVIRDLTPHHNDGFLGELPEEDDADPL